MKDITKYYRHKIQNLLIIQKIITIHYFEFDKSFRSKGEAHDFWELVYADKGNVICTADNREIMLKQGEVLFHKPNEFHTLAADGVNAPNVFIISFECNSQAIHFFESKQIRLNRGMQKFIYNIIIEARKTFDLPCFDPDMKKLKLLGSPTLGGEQLIKNYLEILLISIMRNETEAAGAQEVFLQKEEITDHVARSVIRILEENIFSKLNIDDICKELIYSRSYIFRQFKLATGETVISYFTGLKIDKAKQLIRENELNFTQISEKLMFDSPSYFYKTFKKLMRITPKQYKSNNES